MRSRPTLLLVDDDAPFRQVLAGELGRLGYDTTTAPSGEEALRLFAEIAPDLVLLDLRLPDLDGLEVLKRILGAGSGAEVIMLTGHGSIDTAVESIRLGASDYVAKPCPLGELEVRLQRAVERQALRSRANLLERGLTPPDVGGSFVGATPAFRDVVNLIERVAPTDTTVLVTGETGTGKEMAAKLLHARSARGRRPFVAVQCAALQENLLQSELFGHERGAFTGADRAKPGLFEVAHGGTIFLDEIGEISHATQVSLLRVLDSSTFRHVGGTREIRVDVRVVAATNRDLRAMVRQGLFREDLFYRLSTVTITMPALRTRPADIDLLASHFVRVVNERFGTVKWLAPEVLQALRQHDWPGNVRELLHAIEHASVVCDGAQILPAHLPAGLLGSGGTLPPAGPADAMPTLDQLERTHIEQALRTAAAHRGRAAQMLGISERNLYRKLRQYNLTP
jgi:DNA-binding NtrC family response regulator